MGFSKAFDCISHDVFIAKLHSYDFSLKTVNFFIYSYLKCREQKAKVNYVFTDFLKLLSEVPRVYIRSNIVQYIP